MSAARRLGVVLLAAGKSERFGSDKLLADLGGRPLICRVLEAMRAVPAEKACAVTGSGEVAGLVHQYGFDAIRNDAPELGQSHSIHLGVKAMQGTDAVLLLVGDQPGLTAASLMRLVHAFQRSAKEIACLRDETHMGNPAVFSSKYYAELLAISGDRGARGILKAYSEDLLVVDCAYAHELSDADTPQALQRIRAHMHQNMGVLPVICREEK